MSVILDALKKAQNERKITTKSFPFNSKKKSQKSRWLIYMVASLFFCTLIIFLLIPEPRKSVNPLMIESKAVQVPPPASHPFAPEKTSTAVQPEAPVDNSVTRRSSKRVIETYRVHPMKEQMKIAVPLTKHELDIKKTPTAESPQNVTQKDEPKVLISSIDHEKIALKFNAAINEEEKGNISGAKRLYQSILAEQPVNIEALNNLGVISMKEGNTREALFYFNKILQYNKNYGKAYNNIGLLMAQEGQKKLAEEYFRKSIEIGKDVIEPSLNLAALMRSEKRYEEAGKLLEGFLNTNTKNRYLFLSYALIKDDVGQYEEAIKYYRLYLRDAESSGERSKVIERIKILENAQFLKIR